MIPLLAKADTMESSDLELIKASMAEALLDAGIKTFRSFQTSEALPSPLTVCSSPSKDLENMDASLLMQSDYIQPLHPSQLIQLLDVLFSKNTLTQLKHFSAKKLLQLRKSNGRQQPGSPSPFRTHLNSGNMPSFNRSNTTPNPFLAESLTSVSQALIARPTSGALTFAHAQVTDHTLREERLARVHLANWAAGLQRSLHNERARYAAMAKADRAEWLKARLGECLFDGEIPDLEGKSERRRKEMEMALVSASAKGRSESGSSRGSGSNAMKSRKSSNERRRGGLLGFEKGGTAAGLLDPADPLGLMRFGDGVRNASWVTLKVVGVGGMLGALVWWAARTWNWSLEIGAGLDNGVWSEWWERR